MKTILQSLCLILNCACALFSIAVGQTPPNIVLVLADDIGVGDLSFYQKERTDGKITVKTPNLDRLINEGIRFSDAHSPASLCAPTRFSMLTGSYPYRNHQPFGVWLPWSDSGIEPKFTTTARLAKAGGYRTAFFGKWGLGSVWTNPNPDFTKLDQGARHFGFDYACELPQGIQGEPFIFYENGQWMPLKPDSVIKQIDAQQTQYAFARKHKNLGGAGDSNWDPTLAGEILATKAVDFIKCHRREHPQSPFFLYYCSQAVHIPHAPPTKLDGVIIKGATPSKHGDMILELDTQIGMLRKALEDTGAYENTLFIFTSDNGGLRWDKEMTDAGHDTSHGLRAAKGAIYEGGHRVPFIAAWPARIKPGMECHEPIVAMDVVATIATLAGQPIDRSVIMDAIDMLPLLTGDTPHQRHHYLLHQSKGDQKNARYAIREGDWKLIMQTKGSKNLSSLTPIALFNLRDNRAENENENLINNPEHAARVKKLMEHYREVRQL